MRGRTIFSPVTCQFIIMVKDTSSLEEISQIIKAIIVKTIGINCHSAVLELHIVSCPCQTIKAIII